MAQDKNKLGSEDMQGRLKLNNLNSDVKNWQPLNGISIKDIPEIKDIIDRYAVQGKSVGINELINDMY